MTPYPEVTVLTPDWSVSPPVAEIGVEKRFVVALAALNRYPEGCNQGTGRGLVRSTDPSVVTLVGDSNQLLWWFAGAAPGEATLEGFDVRTPSGQSQMVPLTVCSGPDGDELTCPRRAPLVIRVVPSS